LAEVAETIPGDFIHRNDLELAFKKFSTSAKMYLALQNPTFFSISWDSFILKK
jgi:hypothetical protein